jgi:ABC-2 type transport system permease protein
MRFGRVWAIFLRYFYYFAKLENLSEVFYWPTIDIFLWGMTSVWIQTTKTDVPDIALVILTGLVFWQILWRGNYEITVNILQEFWNRNMVNLFSTPLKLSEWMGATMLVGFVKILITLGFSSLLVYLLYALNIFQVGFAIIPYIGLLTLSGWMMGYFSGAIMIYFGQRFQMLAWMTPFIFAPFSAVFYPLHALPVWGQAIGRGLPTTYIFEGMRKVLSEGIFSYQLFWMSLILNAVYLTSAMILFKVMFEKSRSKGLSRLE